MRAGSRALGWSRLATIVFVLLVTSLAGPPGTGAQEGEAGTPIAEDLHAEATIEPTIAPEFLDPTEHATPEIALADVAATPKGTDDPDHELPVEAAGSPPALYVLAVIHGDTGEPLPGTCWTVHRWTFVGLQYPPVGEFCDADDGFDDGTVNIPFSALPILGPLELLAVQTSAVPAGFPACELYRCPEPFDEETSGDTASLLPYRTLRVLPIDELGAELAGSCFALSGVTGDVCDGDDGTDDGIVSFADLLPQAYHLTEVSAPAGYLSVPDRAVDLAPGDVDLAITHVPLSSAGSLLVTKVDAGGEPLAGACFELYRVDDGLRYSPACTAESPDDLSSLSFADLPPGDYELFERRVPAGYYADGEAIPVELVAEKRTDTEVENVLAALLAVRLVDQFGAPAPGACFELFPAGDNQPIAALACDEDDGLKDGVTQLASAEDRLAAGTYRVHQPLAADGFFFGAPDREVALLPGANEVELVAERIFVLAVSAVDGNLDTLLGACYRIVTLPDEAADEPIEQCDGDDGHHDGMVFLQFDGPRELLLVQTLAPPGYVRHFPIGVFVDRVVEAAIPHVPDELGAEVLIDTVDERGDPVHGACFTIREVVNQYEVERFTGAVAQRRCDADDGADDGRTRFDPVPTSLPGTDPGVIEIEEVLAPLGHRAVAAFDLTIVPGENLVELVHERASGGPAPTPNPDDDDEVDDVTTLPSTGSGTSLLTAGGMAIGWLLLAAGAAAGTALRRGRRGFT